MWPFASANEKPSGLPNNWPNPTEEDVNNMKNRTVRVGLDQIYSFKDNSVKTSKYNIWNFLPKFLMEEFNPKTKIANVYFLLICGLQLIPAISNTGGYPTTLVPLFFIVTIDGIFAAIEDYARHKADKQANSSKTLVFSKSETKFSEVIWSEVKVGDILKVRSRETVPCDVLLIDVAPTVGISDGVCFIETKSLDGETNLKTRQAIAIDKQKIMQQHNSGHWYEYIKGNIDMEHPNSLIDSFSGVFEPYYQREKSKEEQDLLEGNNGGVARRASKSVVMDAISEISDDEDAGSCDVHSGETDGINADNNNITKKQKNDNKLPIQLSNVLLRGCILRNNEWLVGIVLSTGHDTKVMMTSAPSANKVSFVEVKASNAIKYIILFLLSLGFIASTGQIIWNDSFHLKTLSYLKWDLKPGGSTFSVWIVSNFYYLLLHSSIIPVSLYVSMTFARFIQSYFIIQDLEMFNDNNVITKRVNGKVVKSLNPNEQSCIVRTMTLNEELGHVSHIFSDKTGTLTSNIMEFRKMSINGISYGKGITDIGRAAWKLQNKSIPLEVLSGEKSAKMNAIPNVVFYCDHFNDHVVHNINHKSSNNDKNRISDYNNNSNSNSNSNSSSSSNNISGRKEDMPLQDYDDDDVAKIASLKNNSKIDKNNNNNSSNNFMDAKAKIEHATKIDFFFKMLSLCHDAIREADSSSSENLDLNGNVKLSASNPDDQALISAAEYFGYSFFKREENGVIVIRERLDKTVKFKDTEENIDDNSANKNWLSDPTLFVEKRYKVVQTIGFSSKRKRMSVIVQSLDEPDGSYTLFCKGAETVIYERLDKSTNDSKLVQTTDDHLQNFSIEGLRCLLLAYKTVTSEELIDWEENYNKAKSNLSQIESKKKGLPNQIEMLEDEMENGMILLGATGIEDRLQDGVPECIEMLLNAGLNVWVLTGDKEETAINIAVACNLIAANDNDMRRIVINRTTCPNINNTCELMTREIKLYEDELLDPEKPKARSLVIDGPSLVSIFTDISQQRMFQRVGSSMIVNKKNMKKFSFMNAEQSFASVTPLNFKFDDFMPKDDSKNSSDANKSTSQKSGKQSAKPTPRDLFVKMAMNCKSVVCCRVSPDQKREVVNIIRKTYPNISTLAIGDGANDVAMIKEAHIGVGIKGEEGVQAVNASDYAITQFRFLSTLLLKHGRFNYIRLTRLICYVFYKNILMTMGLFWFNLYCGYSGQKIYTEAAIQLYNLFFTSLPIIIYAGYDMDIDVSSVYSNPQVYSTGKDNKCFDTKTLLFYIGNAILDSLIITLTSFQLMNKSHGMGVADVEMPGVYPTSSSGDPFGSRGYLGSFWEVGAVIYTAIVIVVNLKMFLIQSNWSWLHYAALFVGFASWMAVAFGVSSYVSLDFDWYCIFYRLMTDGPFWLTCLLCITAVSIKDIAALYIKKELFRSIEDDIQEKQYQNKLGIASVTPLATPTNDDDDNDGGGRTPMHNENGSDYPSPLPSPSRKSSVKANPRHYFVINKNNEKVLVPW